MRNFVLLITLIFIWNCQSQESKLTNTFKIKTNSENAAVLKITKYNFKLERMIEIQVFENFSQSKEFNSTFEFIEPSIYKISDGLGKEYKIAVENPGEVTITLGNEIVIESEAANLLDFNKSIQNLSAQYFDGMIEEFDVAMKENDNSALIELEKRKEALMPKFTEAMEDLVRDMGASAMAFDAMQYFDLTANYGFIVEMNQQFKSKYPESEMSKSLQKRLDYASKLAIGNKAPAFNSKNLQGEKFTLKNLEGKYVLLDFWASWCRPCRVENPRLVESFDLYKGFGFDIVSISIDKDATKWKQAIKEDSMLWTQILDSMYEIYKVYGLSTIPSNFLLDKKGQIIAKNISADDLHEYLKTVLIESKRN